MEDTFLSKTEFTSLIEEGTSLAGRHHDKILISEGALEDYVRSGVLKFDRARDLRSENPGDISDHYPIWIELYINRDTQ